MGTREEVSLRSLKDSKDSEVQAGAELGELGRRGRYQRRARPTCLDGEDGERLLRSPQEGNAPVDACRTPPWGGLDMEASIGTMPTGVERGAHRYKARVPIDRELAERLSR